MFITDAQVHIWGANTPERPWPEGGEARTHRVTPIDAEELIREMDGAGVDRTVIVPPSWEGDRNDLALAAAKTYPERLAVMGRLDLRNPEALDFARWRDQQGMLGVRLTFHLDTTFADAEWFWPKAAEAALPVMVFAPGQTSAIGEVAGRYPDVRFVIDHLNLSTSARAEDLTTTIEPLLPLAALDNVAVKISALPCAVEEDYPFPSLTPLVRTVVDAFGAERSMWGSDLSRLPCPYRDWVNAMSEGLGGCSAAETEWIMGKAIARWLDWPEPAK